MTLDSRQFWFSSDSARLQEAFGSDCFLRLCVDGGLRGNGEAAAGFALYSWSRPSKYTALVRQGEFLNCVSSSFQSEAMALEFALDRFLNFLNNYS